MKNKIELYKESLDIEDMNQELDGTLLKARMTGNLQ